MNETTQRFTLSLRRTDSGSADAARSKVCKVLPKLFGCGGRLCCEPRGAVEEDGCCKLVGTHGGNPPSCFIQPFS